MNKKEKHNRLLDDMNKEMLLFFDKMFIELLINNNREEFVKKVSKEFSERMSKILYKNFIE